MAKAACIVSSGIAPGAALEGLLSRENITLAAVDLLCGEHKNKEERKYEVVLVASSSQQSRETLASAARSLVPGGRLYVFEEASVSGNRFEALQRDLLLSGFTEAKQLSDEGSSQPLWATATLPQWGLGASAKLSLKRSAATAAAPAPAPAAAAPAAAAAVWKLDDGDEDEELLDDDALLTAEDKKAGPTVKPDDCEVGTSGRKACKNCSCGRAEAEAAGVKATLTPEMLDNPTSACGSCGLGDAFRCASCPYRGLPSFEPGQKITLGANMLVADV